MSPDRLKQLGIALVILVFLWGTAEILGGNTDEREELSLIDDVEMVDRVMVRQQGDTILLERTADKWTVNGLPASTTTAAMFLAEMEDSAYATSLVASSESSHERMGVDAASGRHIVLSDPSGERAHLIFGSNGPGYNERYVRVDGDQRVFLVRGQLVQRIGLDRSGWRNKSIAAFESPEVESYTVGIGSSSFTVVRTDDGWTFEGGQAANSEAIEDAVARFRSFTATGFPDSTQNATADFERPDRTITLVGGGELELLTLALDSIGESEFLARKASTGEVFRVPKWQIDAMAPPEETFRP